MIRGIAAVLRAFDDARDRSEFYRTWSLGHAAGLTPAAIFAPLGHVGGSVRALHVHLLDGTRSGRDIADLVRTRPALFEPFEAALLTMAEESGTLDRVLRALADHFERQHRMLLVVKKHLAYPFFVSLVAIWIAPLPLVLRHQGRAYFAVVGLGLLAWAAFGGGILASRSQAYQRKPAFVRARLARTLMMTLEAGLPLTRSLRLAAGASGEPALVRHVARIPERTLAMQSIEVSLTGAPGVTPEFLGAVRVAEATGDFRTTLGRLAELYEDGFR